MKKTAPRYRFKTPPAKPKPPPVSESPDITDADMALLNEFIHDPNRSDTLRLAALKLKVARETAMLKERVAEKSGGMHIVVNTLADEDTDEDA